MPSSSVSAGTPGKMRRDSTEDYTLPSGAVLRRFALFVDGMARAMILPFGPRLVYRLVNGYAAEITPTTWSAISFQLALVISAFMVGRFLGTRLAQKIPIMNQKLHLYVSRLGGVAISLHIFSHGAGLETILSLVAIRFFSAMVVGILSGITDPSSLPEDTIIDLIDSGSQDKPVDPCSDIASGTAKIYLSGFAASILSGGLIYMAASENETFQALTGSHKFTWSPLFLITSTVAGEFMLRYAFALTAQPEHLDSSVGTNRRIRRVVRRIVGGSQMNTMAHRVSFKDDWDPEAQSLLGSPGPIRQRAPSAASAFSDKDEFFDCQSQFSDTLDTSRHNLLGEEEAAEYVNRKCCFPDGSPAYVPHGDSPAIVPSNYLEFYRDQDKAKKKWQETQQWRFDMNVWKIHTMPNQYFFEIKKAYPHFVHGYTKQGFPVMYEQPGKMNLKQLFQGNCTVDDMVFHYIYFQEFLSNCLCASGELRKVAGKQSQPYNSSEYGLIVVMDIGGAGVSMLSTDVVKYLSAVGGISGAHYPMTMKRAVVVNCPWWASSAYSAIKNALPSSVNVDLLSGNNCLSGLREHIDDDQIPPEYGGSSPYRLGEHPFEKKFERLAEQCLNGDIEAVEEPAVVSLTPDGMFDVGLNDDVNENSTPRPVDEHLDPDHRMRRRAVNSSESSKNQSTANAAPVFPTGEGKVGVDTLAFVSFFCAFWSAAQGGIEIAIPLWLSSPERFGGLGYSPSWSGTTMFCAAVLLFGLLTTRLSRLVSNMPRQDPLRALRLGLGAESVSLCLLASVPIHFDDQANSTLIWTLTIIFMAFVACAGILGRASSSILRGMVTDGFAGQSSSNRSLNIFNMEELIAEFTSGKPAILLGVLGEVSGVFVISEMWSLSVNRVTPSKYDGSQCLFLPALLAFSLFFVSFFLRLSPKDNSRLVSNGGLPSYGSAAGASYDLELSSSGTKTRRKAV